MNWSVWEHEKIRKGDTVYMLKVGDGPTGIVAKGKVLAKAYRGEDWSGKKRKTYYVNFRIICMVSPDCAPILDTPTLQFAIPSVDWQGGHSGVMISTEEADMLDKAWDDYLHKNFGPKPKSQSPKIFVRASRKSATESPKDERAGNLGAELYNYLEDMLAHEGGNVRWGNSNYLSMIKTIAWLLNDYPASPACANVNIECTKNTRWDDADYLQYLRKAVESVSILKENGIYAPADLDELKLKLAQREAFSNYTDEAEEKSYNGELMDDLRDLIDGFDLISHGNTGSFLYSELLSIAINHDDDAALLKFHMLNDADLILQLRFEGSLQYDIHDHYAEGMELFGGYFYRLDDRVYLKLNPLGNISAEKVRVISIAPAEDDE